MSKISPLAHALECADRGWAVFPAGNDKRPCTPNGHKAASIDPQRIRAMWVQYGGPLVGISTGAASNLAVLDIDKKPGGLEWWQTNRHNLPIARAHRSRSGGLHLYFLDKPGLRCSAGRLVSGVDVRAEGGYIIYWPATGLPVLSDAPLADWPDWLMPPPKPAPEPPALPTFRGETAARRYVEAAMRRAIQEVASAQLGTRNASLNRATYSLLRLVETGAVTAREIAGAMAHAAAAAGLPPREIEATLTSALSAHGGA